MQVNPGTNTLLKGVLGSTAFGLNNKDSDLDYGGIFVVPTVMLHGLTNIQESYQFKKPDTWYHEAGKFCRLALKCNPTILDLLWLKHYNCRTALGTELVNLRQSFLSEGYVANAYFGYATSQLIKLKDRKAEIARPAKHARHMLRLLQQGYQLYSTGSYSVKVLDAEHIVNFGETVGINKDFSVADNIMYTYKKKFENTKSVLPAKPDTERVETWLQKVRHEFYQYGYQDSFENLEKPQEWP